MTDQKYLRELVEQVLRELGQSGAVPAPENKEENGRTNAGKAEDGEVADVTKLDLRKAYLVPHPINGERYLEVRQHTPARIGIWRAGPRYLTSTSLRFRADHSAAQDAVFSYVSEDFIKQMGLFTVQTLCVDKDEYVTRPDLGRKISEEGVKLLLEKCKKNPTVQLIAADGLSSSAIEANLKDIMPAIEQGLKSYNIDVGTPFFIKLGRVGAMDHVSELLNAEVTCLLVGERPGLVTAESMSAYIAYHASIGMPEARRTVVSNIHRGGTNPAEAGAHIADIIRLMLDKKASGTDLKL